ncbi:MAG: proteasome assembly chaperone family protein [Candidatus Micrarchaeota archaeon]|nr:proteasome assembly chaperone family protein [Candidatus Micrarchaeota archaeon]MDE1805079.1 proteasome assembly chaperone family protein [Candidatus Micrarchaeota archaeon]MDE1847257.1 proteasome assembly chaperone family protein [Candidatus Micrarchaeota archaeon]
MIGIRMFKDTKLKGYTLIEGFPGAGLVGPMANSYIIEKLNMDYIGFIESDAFPPIAAVHGGVPMFPVRVYKEDRYKLVVIMSEFTIPVETIRELTDELINFVRKQGVSQIISIGGMPTQKPTDVVYGIATTQELMQKLKSAKINVINEGVVAGVSALLLANSVQFGMPVMDLLIPVDPTIMDPKNAVSAIKALKKVINVDISTEELSREAQIVEAKVKEILKKTRDTHESYKNAVDATGPSMYA